MGASRADVSHRRGKVARELPLYIEVPLQDIIPLRVVLDVRLRQVIQREQPQGSLKERTRRQLGGGAGLVERSSLGLLRQELVGQRQHVVNPEARADGRPPVAPRVPGKPYSRLEVQPRRIQKEGIAQMGLRSGEARQGGEL